MSYLFTPAAERALAEAAHWPAAHDRDALDMPALLLGLLSQSECRAAAMLRGRGITEEAIQRNWPALRRTNDAPIDSAVNFGRQISPALRPTLRTVEEILFDAPRPLALATEHLLLGLVASDAPVGTWLAEQGFTVDGLAAEIRQFHGIALANDAPVEIEPDLVSSADAGELADDKAIAEPPARWNPPDSSPSPAAEHTAARDQAALFRLLDALANRAREAVRVLEDYTRFVRDDAFLSGELKHFRHGLTEILATLPAAACYAARDTAADVGTQITTDSELSRDTFESVAAANCKRLQEALRSLEEFGKLLTPELGARFKQLRYRAYTLERAMAIGAGSALRLAGARLYVLLDGRESAADFAHVVTALIETGVHVIQLRDKRLDDRQLLQRARQLRELTQGSSTLAIVNDRPDLARLSQADGVHLGQDELSVKDARAVLGVNPLVGISTHSIEQARDAVLSGANYLGVGPTFPSLTKHFAEFPGLDLARQVASEIRLPAFAIGGITLDNLSQVLASGLRRVAVGSAITSADSPAHIAAEFLHRLAEPD